MIDLDYERQRAWRQYLLRNPLEALEPRVLLSVAESDIAGPVFAGTAPASVTAPADPEAVVATPLDASGTATGKITDPEQTDRYSFQAMAGQNYSVQIDVATLADGGVAVVDQDGESCLIWAEAADAGIGDAVIWQAAADGTYYLQVCSCDEESTGTYSVAVTPAPAATPLDSSGTASGSITTPNQIDNYCFQATADQHYYLQIDTATLAGGCVTIVDQDGFSSLDQAETLGAGTSDRILWQAPADGTYYLQVTGGDDESVGTYSVSVSVAVPPVATPLDASGTASGTIADPEQTDTYSFQATAGQNFSVQIDAATLADACVIIVDQDGFSYLEGAHAYGAGASDAVVWQAPSDGTYHLQVICDDGESTGTYSVSVTELPVTPLGSSGTASGNITDPNQTDIYSFQATAGQNYNVQIDTASLADSCVAIVDQDGIWPLKWVGTDGAGTSSSVVWKASVDGTFYLQVTNNYGESTGSYSVAVSAAQPPASTPLDSFGTASGKIADSDEIDVYSFQTMAGQNYLIQIDAATLENAVVTIVDRDGFTSFDWAEAVGAGSSAAVVWQAPADGIYYLQVSARYEDSAGAYSVSATPTSLSVSNPDDGHNSQFASVGPMEDWHKQIVVKGGGRLVANAAGRVPRPAAAHSGSGRGVSRRSAEPVADSGGIVADLAHSKAAPGLFASQSAPIDGADLLHKPDNLLGSDDALL